MEADMQQSHYHPKTNLNKQVHNAISKDLLA